MKNESMRLFLLLLYQTKGCKILKGDTTDLDCANLNRWCSANETRGESLVDQKDATEDSGMACF